MLKAEQQHRDGARTGNEPAGQAEHDDLSDGNIAVGKMAADVTSTRVGETAGRNIEAPVRRFEVLDRMVIMMIVPMAMNLTNILSQVALV